MTPSKFSPGDVIDSYVIVRLLGAGAMGEVYAAEQPSPRRVVALKLLRSDLEPDARQLKRFAREIDAMASVEHENVVPIYAQGEWRGLSESTGFADAG